MNHGKDRVVEEARHSLGGELGTKPARIRRRLNQLDDKVDLRLERALEIAGPDLSKPIAVDRERARPGVGGR